MKEGSQILLKQIHRDQLLNYKIYYNLRKISIHLYRILNHIKIMEI